MFSQGLIITPAVLQTRIQGARASRFVTKLRDSNEEKL